MDTKLLKRKAEKTIKELNFKIQQLKSKPVDDKLKSTFEEKLKELEQLRDKVKERYEKTDPLKDEAHWDEFEKQIFPDIESFNNAYTEAGRIFDPKHDGPSEVNMTGTRRT